MAYSIGYKIIGTNPKTNETITFSISDINSSGQYLVLVNGKEKGKVINDQDLLSEKDVDNLKIKLLEGGYTKITTKQESNKQESNSSSIIPFLLIVGIGALLLLKK